MADDPTVTDPDNEPDPTDGDPTPEEEPTTPDEDEWTPPTREEYEAAQTAHQTELEKLRKEQTATAAALKRANGEAATRKKALADLTKQHEDDESRAKREATEAALAQVKPVAIRAEAKAQLLAAKAKTDRLDALMSLLNMGSIDIDGENVTGLDVEVERLAAGFPEFFVAEPEPVTDPAPKRDPKPKVPALDTSGRKPANTDTPKSFGELVAQKVLGKK